MNPPRARQIRCQVLSTSLALVAAACAPPPAVAAPPLATLPGCPVGDLPPAADTVMDRLYFGRNVGTREGVRDRDWSAFRDAVISRCLPQGFTVYAGAGQWKQGDAIIRERSFVLEVVHPASARADSAMASVARLYAARFGQEAVMRVTTRVTGWRFYQAKP